MLGDAFDVAARFPFLGKGFGHGHTVALDVSLVVVNNRPAVGDLDFDLLRRRRSFQNHVRGLAPFDYPGGQL